MDQNLITIRHERSKKDYPELNLEDDEYVELAFVRATVCYFLLWGVVALGLIVLLLALLIFANSSFEIDNMGRNFMTMIVVAILAVLIIGGLIVTKIYRSNKMFITNKRVTQMIMHTLVSNSVNIIDLSSIEDVSFRQNSLVEKLFGYGTLRLSTVGDETTYTFPCAKVDPKEISLIVKLVNDDKEKNDGKGN